MSLGASHLLINCFCQDGDQPWNISHTLKALIHLQGCVGPLMYRKAGLQRGTFPSLRTGKCGFFSM
ncbi:unnamed protein product [Staurois parvus]|uniref:Uncharacterized protein n=1 Tax=Staurois parvus TaxID=386267 RepID=A0ABN9B1P5_9NEOB|nr:unnamed protein product [Staurois parvus]